MMQFPVRVPLVTLLQLEMMNLVVFLNRVPFVLCANVSLIATVTLQAGKRILFPVCFQSNATYFHEEASSPSSLIRFETVRGITGSSWQLFKPRPNAHCCFSSDKKREIAMM